MTSIPGTDYQLRGNSFVGSDGTELNAQQFLDKVKDKEISLTADSLQMLATHLGPDLMQSLRSSSTQGSAPQQVSERLNDTDKTMGDVFNLLVLMAKFSQDQRKTATDIRQSQSNMQIDAMQKSADQFMAAAWVRFGTGMASAAATAVQAGISLSHTGAGLSNKLAKVEQARGEGMKTLVEVINKAVGTTGELVASGIDKGSKDSDIQAQRMAQQLKQTEELLDNIRETEAKVKEAFSQGVQATGRTFTV
jgi:hypothetical protein